MCIRDSFSIAAIFKIFAAVIAFTEFLWYYIFTLGDIILLSFYKKTTSQTHYHTFLVVSAKGERRC